MKIMMKLLILLTCILTSSAWAGNSIYISGNDTSGSGSGETIFIKQDGANNKVGTSMSSGSEDYFDIHGNNVTVIIKQIGDSNTTAAWSTFKCTNCTLDYQVNGDSNVLNTDIDEIDDSGWWIDVDITGNSNILAINDTNQSTNGVQNFNVDLDIRGDSNDIWLNHNGNADNHHLYVYVYGDSNDIEYNMVNGGTGKNTTANAAVGHYNSPDHGMVGDPDLVTIDFWIIGSSNTVHGATHGDNNYMLVEVYGSGQSNILDVHPNANCYVRMVQLGDNEKAYLRVSGSNNTFGMYQDGGNNTLYLYQTTSDSTIYAWQENGGNTGTINVSGESIYDYTLNYVQNNSGTCTYSFDRNTQSSNTTVNLTNCQ